MAAGLPILARDTVYNREILGPEGRFVGAEPTAISRTALKVMKNRPTLDQLAPARIRPHKLRYSWQKSVPTTKEHYED